MNKHETTFDAASLVGKPLLLSERDPTKQTLAVETSTKTKYKGFTYGTQLIKAFECPAIDTCESVNNFKEIIAINANVLNMFAGCLYFVEPDDVSLFFLFVIVTVLANKFQ